MKAKKLEKAAAIEMRNLGVSIRQISKTLKISSSTASLWCRNIILTKKQRVLLDLKSVNTPLLRQYAQRRHIDKLNRIQEYKSQAKILLYEIDRQSFFVAGIALYWAEGFKAKNEGRIGFCNSDPKMIIFMIKWFKKFLKVKKEDFVLRCEFNVAHFQRKELIEMYWAKIADVPLSQFNKPYLQTAKQLKTYSAPENYFGVLRIRVRQSQDQLYRIKSWIDALSTASLSKAE